MMSSQGSGPKHISGSLHERLKNIRAIFLDVDGVLTDGRVYLGEQEEMKAYSVKDGMGIVAASRANIAVFLVTGRTSHSVTRRAGELGIKAFQGVDDKLECVRTECENSGLGLDEVAFVGDDLNDLQVMKKVGLACAVADAAQEVREIAHYVSERRGGDGAVREIVEKLLRSQGTWNEFVNQFPK